MEQKKTSFPYYLLIVLALLILLLVMLLRFASVSLFSMEPASITVTAEDGTQLNWVVEKNHWNGSAYDREHTFVCYDRAGLMPSQLPGGTAVTITLGGTIPDEVSLREYALSSNETSAYGGIRLLEELNFYFNGKSGSFSLPQPGDAPVRGYLLTCSWGENTCEYGLVVQLLPE